MPKFIVDECTGVAVAHFLREQSFDAVSISEESRKSVILRFCTVPLPNSGLWSPMIKTLGIWSFVITTTTLVSCFSG